MAELTNEWVSINTDSGSGDTAVTATVLEENSGRTTRSVVLKGTTEHDAVATATIVQSAHSEYVIFEPSSYLISNDATSVTVFGKSNSSKLTFTLITSGIGITDYLTLPSTYTVTPAGGADITVNNGGLITGDPGATSEFTFYITLPLQNTNPSNSRMQRLHVTAYSGIIGNNATVTQEGMASTILFDGQPSGTVYDLTSKPVGGTQTINIGVSPSDEGWTLSFDE